MKAEWNSKHEPAVGFGTANQGWCGRVHNVGERRDRMIIKTRNKPKHQH